jgi:hypothetical protein
MIILPSVFTEKRLKQIADNNAAIDAVVEKLTILKAQRNLLESQLPRITDNANWFDVYNQIEVILVKEMTASNERKRLLYSIMSAIEVSY